MVDAILNADSLSRVGWPGVAAILATSPVLHGYVVTAFWVVAIEQQPLVQALLRSRVGIVMNVLGTVTSQAVVVAPFALPAGLLLAMGGLFDHGPWHLVAVADLVLLVLLVGLFARFGAPMLLDDD